MKNLILTFFLLLSFSTCSKSQSKITVFVSIAPQKYFVKKIAGNHVNIRVMVGKGQNPATYEVLPSQLIDLQRSKLYFRIGVPFENALIPKISNTYRSLIIVDTRKGITLRRMKNFVEIFDRNNNKTTNIKTHVKQEALDPHIWNSPVLVKIQARTIAKALISIDPSHKSDYLKGLQDFENELDKLDKDIREELKQSEISNFMVFHPSWGYFAESYGLKQIPIEIEGKEPSAKTLNEIINFARSNNIRVIFAQPEFSTRSANRIAQAIGGKVALIDPLSEDYLSNMRRVAKTLTEASRAN